MGLLAVGQLPRMTRSPGRKPGKWRGHADAAQELRVLRARVKDPEEAWGKVSERENATKAQSIVSAIKKGEAVGFEHTTGGHFDASARKSPDQSRSSASDGRPRILYDVWARYEPHGSNGKSETVATQSQAVAQFSAGAS